MATENVGKGKFSFKDLFSKIVKSLREFKNEVKKVVWPDKKQIINYFIAVVTMILIIGAFVWCFDTLFSFLISTLLKSA